MNFALLGRDRPVALENGKNGHRARPSSPTWHCRRFVRLLAPIASNSGRSSGTTPTISSSHAFAVESCPVAVRGQVSARPRPATIRSNRSNRKAQSPPSATKGERSAGSASTMLAKMPALPACRVRHSSTWNGMPRRSARAISAA